MAGDTCGADSSAPRCGYRLQLDVFNLLDSKDHQIDYFHLPGEPLEGVMDVYFKPVEPLAVRLTFGGTF